MDEATWKQKRIQQNSKTRKQKRISDDSMDRDEFVAAMSKQHGAWLGPVIVRWLDSGVPERESFPLNDSEIVRSRTPDESRFRGYDNDDDEEVGT